MKITKEDKSKLVNTFAENGDSSNTGSAAVQCAIFTLRIQHLTSHYKKNKKDFQCIRRLLKIVNQRKRMMRFIKKKDSKLHAELLAKLSIRK